MWDCPACTFRNEVPRGPFQMECEVCQTPHEPMTAEERRWLEQEANIEQERLAAEAAARAEQERLAAEAAARVE